MTFYSNRTAREIAKRQAKAERAALVRKDVVLTDRDGRIVQRVRVTATHAGIAAAHETAYSLWAVTAKARGLYIFSSDMVAA